MSNSNPVLKKIQAGDEIIGTYVVRSKKLLQYRNGSGQFLGITLADKTGQLEGRVWDQAEETSNRCRVGDVVKVNGRVSEYNGSFQLHITSLDKCDNEQVVAEFFIPSTGTEAEDVRIGLLELANTMDNPNLQELINLLAGDQDIINVMARCPAAKRNHHAYLGGLWQHSLGVARAADRIASVYSHLDRDLLVTGALLHDIGKIEEYRVKADIDFTSEGRLLGHIVIGTGLVDRLISRIPSFPEVLRLKLLHMIVSHHGQYEWQSPKRPKFIEAAVLHYLDMIDAQIDMFNGASAGKEEKEGPWTGWVKGLERPVFCE